MIDTTRETKALNHLRDQQLAQAAAQRGQDDPSRSPEMEPRLQRAESWANIAAPSTEAAGADRLEISNAN